MYWIVFGDLKCSWFTLRLAENIVAFCVCRIRELKNVIITGQTGQLKTNISLVYMNINI